MPGAARTWLLDLQDIHDTGPELQEWAAKMACLLLWARDAAAAARAAGQDRPSPVLARLITSYHAITTEGSAINRYRHHSANGRTARALSPAASNRTRA